MLKRCLKNFVTVFANLKRWVWGAGAVITAAITLIGFIAAVDAKEVENGRYGSPQSEELLQLPRS